MKIRLDQLTQFLIDSHQHTYAANAGRVNPSLPSSTDLEFRFGDLRYHDTYFGSRNFVGTEIVYEDNIPIWGMSYHGTIVDKDLNTNVIYSFLREALLQDSGSHLPVRGPKEFSSKDGKWQYYSSAVGAPKSENVSCFQLLERICAEHDPQFVYRCYCAGGLL